MPDLASDTNTCRIMAQDTVFLIDLWREARSPGRAMQFAADHKEQKVGINWVVAGEFTVGAQAAGQDAELVRRFLGTLSHHSTHPSHHSAVWRDLR